MKQAVVDVSDKLKKPEILEAGFNYLSNNMFHQFSMDITEEVGIPSGERVFPLWQEWMKKTAKGWRI